LENANNIRGHMCEGLRRFQDYSTYSCIPSFNENGSISGCDDTNEIRIKYCPFCGEELAEVKEYKYTCSDCGETWNSYDKDKKCEECYSANITVELI
jgi:hypothetical protein